MKHETAESKAISKLGRFYTIELNYDTMYFEFYKLGLFRKTRIAVSKRDGTKNLVLLSYKFKELSSIFESCFDTVIITAVF